MIIAENIKVGDIVIFNGTGVCDIPKGSRCRVTCILGSGVSFTQLEGRQHHCWEPFESFDPASTENENNYEVKGEEKMTSEEVNRPEYIIIARNTEVFKKGGVFKNYTSFYAAVDGDKAFTVKPYGDPYILSEQVDVLLQKKVAVEAVKFDPEFVTLEQNEALQAALEKVNKPVRKTTKKQPVKK